jgi:Domain of unknown function (DUF5671)
VTTIRRIYAYLLAFAGLAMVSIAMANLVQLLVDLVLQVPVVSSDRYVRDTVSLYAAAALVGLPVWLVHWLWIGRSVRADPEERASTLRRLYVYAVLVGATIAMAGSATDALNAAFAALGGVPTPDAAVDAFFRPLPFTLIALGVWLAHWRIAATDRALVGERGGSAALRRWYVYGAALVGLVLLLTGTSGVVESLWRIAARAGVPAGLALARPAADALVGLGLWLVHWVVLPRRLSEADTREDETTSVLRSVYLFLALAVAVVGSLLGVSQLLYYAVARLLGVDHPGGVGGDLLQAAAGPASIAIVYGAAWAYQRVALRRQPATSGETPRQAGVRRLYIYLVALVALGVLASGVAGLLWTLGDVVFSGSAATTGSGWREQVALYATLTIVGLPVWLLHWRPIPASAAEARSLARRLYVYLSLIVAMLALVGSAAAGLYQLLGLALGSSFSMSVAADLVHALAVASVAALLAAYHWRVVRADAHAAHPQTSEAHEPASIVVEIQAPDSASLSTAISMLRSTGVHVRVIASGATVSRP